MEKEKAEAGRKGKEKPEAVRDGMMGRRKKGLEANLILRILNKKKQRKKRYFRNEEKKSRKGVKNGGIDRNTEVLK